MEDQNSIVAWADATFGKSDDLMRLTVRAHSEVAELLRAVFASDSADKISEECADVMIILYRVAAQMDFNLDQVKFDDLPSFGQGMLRLEALQVNDSMAVLMRRIATLIIINRTDDPLRNVTLHALRYLAQQLFTICARLTCDLSECVDKKMAINRERRWEKGGDGSHHHVRIAT